MLAPLREGSAVSRVPSANLSGQDTVENFIKEYPNREQIVTRAPRAELCGSILRREWVIDRCYRVPPTGTSETRPNGTLVLESCATARTCRMPAVANAEHGTELSVSGNSYIAVVADPEPDVTSRRL